MKTTRIPATLTDFEQRGWITYLNPNGRLVTAEGWYMLTVNGHGVVRRKVGGRNRSLYCSVDSMLSFELEVK